MRLFLTSLFLTFTSTGTLLAGDCGTPICRVPKQVCAPIYHEPILTPAIVPVALPVFVPTVFQYLPALTPTPVAINQSAVPVQMPISNQVNSAESNIDTIIRARLEVILKEKALGTTQDDIVPLLDPSSMPTQNAQKAPERAPEPNTAQSAMNVVGRACMACHNAQKASGGVSLVDGQNKWAPTKDGAPLATAEIAKVVASGRMPKLNATLGNQALSNEEKFALLNFLK